MDNQPVDKQALALTHAIALQESGSGGKPDYTASGDAGTSKGAYQWQPGNFESAAKTAGLDPTDFSPENQDKVAYSEVKAYKDKGYDPGQIASLWNSGSPNNWQNHSGTTTINGKKISYDTPAYVKGVQKYYSQITGSSPSTDSSLTQDTNITPASSSPTPAGGALLNNPITTGIKAVGNALTGGGAGELGNEVGTSLAKIYDKAKGFLGGRDDSQYIAPPDVNAALAGGAKSLVGAAAVQGAGELPGLLTKGSAMADPEISTILQSSVGKGETLADLSRQDAIDALGNALKEQPVTDAGGATEQKILAALKELNPTLAEKTSLLKRLGSTAAKMATGYIAGKTGVVGKIIGLL